MTRRVQPLLLWLALLSQVLCVVGGRALVRCVEADGRSSVELSFAGCCEDEAPADAGDSSPVASRSDEECPACVDGSLGEAPLVVASSGTALSLPPVAWEQAERVVFARPRAARAPACGPRAPPALAALRTVVIRC